MKKGMIFFFCLMIAAALTACGTKSDKETSAGAGDHVYKIATDATYAPMESMDKSKIVGFDVDFLAAVMKEANLKYTLSNIGWDGMLQSVKAGSYDAGISSVSITDERKQTYDFSMPYFESTNMILVTDGSPIQNALDLKDKKVAVQGQTTADTLMSDIMGATNTNLKKFESNVLAFMELENHGVDAAVADIAIVREYVKNNPKKKFIGILDKENFPSEYYGILLPKNSELKAKLDPAIKNVISNGKYAEIYKKWFGEEPNTDTLLSAKP
ncbi:basic amino acid ABC transporter substrate-binding protein [Gorillibacterium massiliense]|uniref:basic amino acid ABC transporter substrate-binding protein n=1 Tax=Gorillibacterium massiliense TaxID=1280390 RepID=UPI0004AEF2FA|nr:basic amino acid ABC transporter substrate-binding protein [Gorillibacterium massiliense]